MRNEMMMDPAGEWRDFSQVASPGRDLYMFSLPRGDGLAGRFWRWKDVDPEGGQIPYCEIWPAPTPLTWDIYADDGRVAGHIRMDGPERTYTLVWA